MSGAAVLTACLCLLQLQLLCTSGAASAVEALLLPADVFTVSPGPPVRHSWSPSQHPMDSMAVQHIRLIDLEPSSNYEVRVSYLGTLPYSASLRLVEPLTASALPSARRRLLDVEKLLMSTDAHGRVEGALNSTVELSLVVSGRFPSAEAERRTLLRDVEYVISCERLALQAAPSWVLGLLVCLLLAVFAILRWIVPGLILRISRDALLPSLTKKP